MNDLFGGANIREPFDAEYLRSILRYDPDTGQWRWVITRGNGAKRGCLAGSIHHGEYRRIKINGISFCSAVLAWLYMTGEWPKFEVDHKDRNKQNDKWANLRSATHGQQQANSVRSNGSGIKGVRERHNGRWKAQIWYEGKAIYLGTFATREDAIEARRIAGQTYFGEFDLMEEVHVALLGGDLFCEHGEAHMTG
jgi:HNH endonuclease